MNLGSKKYFYIVCGIFAVMILLIIAGTFGGTLLLQKQADKLTRLKVENRALSSQQAALIQAQKDIERYSELEKVAASVVPQDKDQAKTIREIVAIAGANNVQIKSIDFEASTLGTSATAQAVPGGSGSTAVPAPAGKQAATSQLKTVTGINGVSTLELKVQSGGAVSYQNFLKFLEGLEKNRRTAHVSLINLTPNPKNGALLDDFKLTLDAYVKP